MSEIPKATTEAVDASEPAANEDGQYELFDQNDLNNQEAQEDNRDVSPTGAKIVRAAERINDYLEGRAINKAHGEALKENAARDKAAQDEAFASYEGNVATTANREAAEKAATDEMNALHAEANKDNRKFDREARIESAKESVRKFGRNVLKIAAAGGNLILGAGLLTGEAAVNGAKAVGSKAGEAYSATKAKAGEAINAAGDYVDGKVDAVNAKAEALNQKTEAAAERVKAVPGQIREWRRGRKEAAEQRRAERNTQKAEKRQATKEKYENRIRERNEKRQESVRKAEQRRATRRAKWATRGNNAKEFASDKAANTRDYLGTKKKNVGVFANRVITAAKAAHAAGKQSWEDTRPSNQ